MMVTPWHGGPGHRWKRQLPDVESSCECVE